MYKLYHIKLKGTGCCYCVFATRFIIINAYADSSYLLMKFYLDDLCVSMIEPNEVEYVSYFTDIFYNEVYSYKSVPFPEVGEYE